jgi:hypothetical protein
MPPGGYVPDETTAIAIAKAVWIPIYGKEQIESEAPFVATPKRMLGTFMALSPRATAVGPPRP